MPFTAWAPRRVWWYAVLLWFVLLLFAVFYYPLVEGVHRGTAFGIVSLMWCPFVAALAVGAFTVSRWRELRRYQRACGFFPLALFAVPFALVVVSC